MVQYLDLCQFKLSIRLWRLEEFSLSGSRNVSLKHFFACNSISRQVFDFCGGMMFQLALSDKLRTHLANVAEDSAKTENQQPAVFDAAINRMAKIPGYTQNANVDNVVTFHGREVSKL